MNLECFWTMFRKGLDIHSHEYRDAPIHQLCIGGELAGIVLSSRQHLPLAPPGAEQWAVSDHPDPLGHFLRPWMPSPCSWPSLSSFLLLFFSCLGLWEAPVYWSRREWMLSAGWARAVYQVSHRPCKNSALRSSERVFHREPRTQYSSPPCHCPTHPSAWQGTLLPMETMPAQFFTRVGFTAPRLHSAHPPRKRPLLLSLLPGHCIFQAGGCDQGECTVAVPSRLWRRRIRPPPPPGGRSKKDLVAGAGKGWEHSAVPWSQERWFNLRRWKPASRHHFLSFILYLVTPPYQDVSLCLLPHLG